MALSTYLRTVPSDTNPNDVRLYADGADAPPVGGSLSLRLLMGMGLSILLYLLM
jgi:hypothetical protein